MGGQQATEEPSRLEESRAKKPRAFFPGGMGVAGAPWTCCAPAQRKQEVKMTAFGCGCSGQGRQGPGQTGGFSIAVSL